MALFVKSIQIVCSASTRLVLHIRSIVVDFGMSQDNEKFSKADMKGNALLLQSNAFHFRRHPIISFLQLAWKQPFACFSDMTCILDRRAEKSNNEFLVLEKKVLLKN